MFPSRGVWRRPGLRLVDLFVFAALLALLFGLLRLAQALNAPFLPRTAPSTVSTDPASLPCYAVRSLPRMFIALISSVLFTFVFVALLGDEARHQLDIAIDWRRYGELTQGEVPT